VSRRRAVPALALGAIELVVSLIEVGVRDRPAVLVEDPAAARRRSSRFASAVSASRPSAEAWREGIVLGVLNAAIPFTLIALGEKYVDSGVAAVANASVPIFLAILAFWFVPSERSTGLRAVGVLLGIAGVAVLPGVHPEGGWKGALATGAIVLASVSYAAANLYAGRRIRVGGPVLAAVSMVVAFVVLAPLALASLPAEEPGWKSVGSAVVLGLLGTALAQILAYRLIRLYGSSRAVLVAYMLPAFALVYGAVFLDEAVTIQKLAGLLLILGGVGLGSGAVRLSRGAAVARPPVHPAAATPSPLPGSKPSGFANVSIGLARSCSLSVARRPWLLPPNRPMTTGTAALIRSRSRFAARPLASRYLCSMTAQRQR
jgi:drug/metabolite transporter (DMT)-like permease